MNLPSIDRDDDGTPTMHQLTGAYALHALPGDELDDFERWLEDEADADTRVEVRELAATAALLADVAAEAPPADLRDRVLRIADDTRQLPPLVTDLTAERERRRPTWLRVGQRVAIAAAAVVALVVGTTTFLGDDAGEQRLTDVAARLDVDLEDLDASSRDVLAAPDARIVEVQSPTPASVVVSLEQGEAVFVSNDLERVPSDRTYQLWLLRDGEATSVGLFGTDADGTAVQAVGNGLVDVDAVAVSVEPSGGSSAPTTEPVVVVEL